MKKPSVKIYRGVVLAAGVVLALCPMTSVALDVAAVPAALMVPTEADDAVAPAQSIDRVALRDAADQSSPDVRVKEALAIVDINPPRGTRVYSETKPVECEIKCTDMTRTDGIITVEPPAPVEVATRD